VNVGSENESDLLDRARGGDPDALNELFARHRDRLRRMVAGRLDDRLRARVDASDVIQEAQLEVLQRLPEYLANRPLPFYLWLRLEVGKHLIYVHRRHLGADKRDVRRDVPIGSPGMPDPSSTALAAALVAAGPSPSQDAVRAEQADRVRAALDRLEPGDREVLALRHFEMLSRGETAAVLGITDAAASKRYVRALDRLETALAGAVGA